MKIGIFGDSFGEKATNVPETATSKAWTTYLSQEFDVDNHSACGSSFYYSVDLFLKNHHFYDKIIFLITLPGRIEVVKPFAENVMPNRIATFEHARSLVEAYENRQEIFNKKIYQTAVDYFLYFHDFEKDCFFQYAAIDKIKNTRKENVLFLPCFFQSVDESNRKNNELFQITSLDEIDLASKRSGRIGDHRHCHFNDQNNIIFAKNIKNWILNGVWDFNINDYVSMNIDN